MPGVNFKHPLRPVGNPVQRGPVVPKPMKPPSAGKRPKLIKRPMPLNPLRMPGKPTISPPPPVKPMPSKPVAPPMKKKPLGVKGGY